MVLTNESILRGLINIINDESNLFSQLKGMSVANFCSEVVGQQIPEVICFLIGLLMLSPLKIKGFYSISQGSPPNIWHYDGPFVLIIIL
jgi:hypothetical protein